MDSSYPPPPIPSSSKTASLLSGLGQALRWLREKQSRKQYRVADTAGITKGMLSAYETGRQRPSLETLDKLLDTLGCDLNDLHNALQIVNGRPERIKGWRGWQTFHSLHAARSPESSTDIPRMGQGGSSDLLEVRESAPPYGTEPADPSQAGRSQHRGAASALGPGPISGSDLYSVLGYDRPRLPAGEEQALGQMLDGFHNLLRYWHRSLVAIAPPAAAAGDTGAPAGNPVAGASGSKAAESAAARDASNASKAAESTAARDASEASNSSEIGTTRDASNASRSSRSSRSSRPSNDNGVRQREDGP